MEEGSGVGSAVRGWSCPEPQSPEAAAPVPEEQETKKIQVLQKNRDVVNACESIWDLSQYVVMVFYPQVGTKK